MNSKDELEGLKPLVYTLIFFVTLTIVTMIIDLTGLDEVIKSVYGIYINMTGVFCSLASMIIYLVLLAIFILLGDD